MHTITTLAKLIKQTSGTSIIKSRFVSRLSEGYITRDENPHSHFCVYFAAYDPGRRLVFIGHHRKSGLWLFNGGHLDRSESVHTALEREIKEEWGIHVPGLAKAQPSLLTITPIENPKKQTCTKHFDIWFFIPFNKDAFAPNKNLLKTEFYTWGWKSQQEAMNLMTDRASIEALHFLSQLFLH